jgi:hypothetical protein
MSYFTNLILAIMLPSLRISPLLAFVLVVTGTLLLNVMDIQSIGSGLTSFGDLFIFSLVPVKPKRLTNLEKSQFTLSDELKQILVGLILGDLYIEKRCLNACLRFSQGTVHELYLMYLFELFKSYCGAEPKTQMRTAEKISGKLHESKYFNTFALPCFNTFHELFYLNGKKVVPANIEELLTPIGIAHWICDDGSFNKWKRSVILNTQSFTLDDVELLMKVLTNKFNLNCTINKNTKHYVIRISSHSLPILQDLLAPHMPTMMKHKIGL